MIRVPAKVATAALAAALLVNHPAFAQKPEASGGVMTSTAPGKGVAVATATVTARVSAIDKATRTVTLEGPAGRLVEVVAGPEVRNFDRIKVGDQLVVQYAESLMLELKKGGTALVARTDTEQRATARPGEKPAAAAGREVRVTADVIAVDRATGMVTLRGPRRTLELQVHDPKQLELIEKGDQVEATYTEAVAVAIEPVKPAAAKK